MTKVYTSKGCGPCKTLKQYLKNKKVEFEELDRESPGVAEEMMKLTGTVMTPALVTDKGVMSGLNFSRLTSLL